MASVLDRDILGACLADDMGLQDIANNLFLSYLKTNTIIRQA